MTDGIDSRRIAEHLCTLASLLEAEVIRANSLGITLGKDLASEAREVRSMANRLWEADTYFVLGIENRSIVHAPVEARLARERRREERMKMLRGQTANMHANGQASPKQN